MEKRLGQLQGEKNLGLRGTPKTSVNPEEMKPPNLEMNSETLTGVK